MAQGNLIGTPGRALVLAGFMGAGKSSAARALVDGALDSDALIEAETGIQIERLFERDGEEAFRAIEERVVLEALDRAAAGEGGGVVSLGGGALGSERVRDALKAHLVVLIDADVDTCWQRVRNSRRPLASDRDRFAELFELRRGIYGATADVFVPSDGAARIRKSLPDLQRLAGCPAGTRLVIGSGGSATYPVFVGEGLLGVQGLIPEGRFVLISDVNVERLHGGRFTGEMARVTIEAGESAKNLDTLASVWGRMAQAGVTRDDAVFALGGGVVGDLAGFAAAAFQRGIPVNHFPTTLVAQVDSSLGGKTGVDIPEGKNYIGAYHQPSSVVADTATLETLPDEERAAGMAEVIKTALISGGPLWDAVVEGRTVDSGVIVDCVRTKLGVVAEDERDGGRRQVLNLGHTIGHAIETATGYSRLRHGEAVAIGLMAALRLSGVDALRTTVGDLLGASGLPLRIDGVGAERVVDLVSADKKARSDGTVPFVLCESPGNVSHGHEIPRADLEAAVREVVS